MNLIALRARLAQVQSSARNGAIALVCSVPVLASAQADPFTDAMTEATEKVGIYAAALVGLGAVAVIFMIALKYVKKIPRAS